MNTSNQLNDDQLHDLFIARATEGLNQNDQDLFDIIIKENPSLLDLAESYEMAAAELDVAYTHNTVTNLSSDLRNQLIAEAPLNLNINNSSNPPISSSDVTEHEQPAAFNPFNIQWLGWYVAAAALIALMVLVPPSTNTPPDLETAFNQLQNNPNSIKAKWGFNTKAGDKRYANVTGQVVFNPSNQFGYMKFTGLPINKPTKEQYQLWIVDPTRASQPIDGGVFDVTASGEVIIPIDAKLRTDNPVAFAITVEKPGGVVVSKGPLHIVAPVPSNNS